MLESPWNKAMPLPSSSALQRESSSSAPYRLGRQPKPGRQEIADYRAGKVHSGSPPCFLLLPVGDSLLFPLLHGEGPHGPDVGQGLIGYTCRPRNLQGVPEAGGWVGAGAEWQGQVGTGTERLGRGAATCS